MSKKKASLSQKVKGFVFPSKVLKPIKDYLIEQQKKMIRKKKSLEEEDPFNDTERFSRNSTIDAAAAAQFGHQRVEAIKAEVDKGLVLIRMALSKMKKGKWGICESCGNMINTDRLAIDPTVSLCMNCHRSNDQKSGKNR